jgi:hypothetical protein
MQSIYCRIPSTQSNSLAVLLDFELIILIWVRASGEKQNAHILNCKDPKRAIKLVPRLLEFVSMLSGIC